MPAIPLPTDCVVAVTYLCNSRCTMCDFWKETRQPTLTLADYAKLPATLRDINVSGGEPFLHPKIVEIVRTLHATCPKARITISTNGFLTDLIVRRVREIQTFFPAIGIRISVDGVDTMHEQIRRIPQALEKDLATLRALRDDLGIRDLGLAYTMVGENVDHLPKVAALARAEGVAFTCAVAHSSEFYFGGKQNIASASREEVAAVFDAVIAEQLRTWHPKTWARAYFVAGLKRFALDQVQMLPSRPGTDFFFLDPFGTVYPSVMHPSALGNLAESSSFAALWMSDRAAAARGAVAKWSHPYWLICTARTAMRRHLPTVVSWILRAKLRILWSGSPLRIDTASHATTPPIP